MSHEGSVDGWATVNVATRVPDEGIASSEGSRAPRHGPLQPSAVPDELTPADEARVTGAARYAALFKHAPDGIVVTTPDLVCLDANDSICRMLGYARDEIVGMHARGLIADVDLPHLSHALEIINDTSGYHRDWKLRRKDGVTFEAEVIATKIPDGSLLAMVRDMTERRLADEKAADAFRELREVRAALDEHAIVAITDARGKITFVNDKFCAISQYSRDEIIGQDHRIINSGYHSKEFIRSIWKTITAGRVWKGEIKNKAKDGSYYWVDTTIVPYLGEDGKPIEYIAIRADITERKRFETALRQKNVELENANRMKSEFLANMSHELRTPLNAILGFSEVLKDGLVGDMTERQQEFASEIFSSGTHLLSLINDILDLSKVEAGKMTLDLERVHVHALLTNSLSIIREKAAAREISLTLDAADDLDALQADARKIKQIVYNLMANAVKFTGDGGHVTLRARRVPRAEVGRKATGWSGRYLELPQSDYAEFLEISVIDDGIGISSGGLNRLFTPFTQIDGGLSRKFEGTGLGLALVRQLVELHLGTVAVESGTGEGSSFIVWLPWRNPNAVASEEAAGRPRGVEATHKALLMEEDPKAASVIRALLEEEGFEVCCASSVDAALLMAAQEAVSLVTVDIRVSKSKGRELLNRLGEVPELKEVPVVAVPLTAVPFKRSLEEAAAVMKKPLSRQGLCDELERIGLLPLKDGQALRVLAVDDDPRAVDLVVARLSGLASTVLHAHSGREAIDVATQLRPDAILLDLFMPQMNGFEVIEALKSDPETAGIPILVVSARQTASGDETGAVTFLGEEEFDREQFVRDVRRAMSTSRETAA